MGAALADTKTGLSVRPLSHAACNVLRTVPRIGAAGLVFPRRESMSRKVACSPYEGTGNRDAPRDT
jgi:hypothetical protein